MANEDSTTSDGTADEAMTVVNGVRVRKDEEKLFSARHKAVLAPEAGAITAEVSRPKATRGKKAGAGGGQPDS